MVYCRKNIRCEAYTFRIKSTR